MVDALITGFIVEDVTHAANGHFDIAKVSECEGNSNVLGKWADLTERVRQERRTDGDSGRSPDSMRECSRRLAEIGETVHRHEPLLYIVPRDSALPGYVWLYVPEWARRVEAVYGRH